MRIILEVTCFRDAALSYRIEHSEVSGSAAGETGAIAVAGVAVEGAALAGEGEGVDEETSGARIDADPVASEHIAAHAKDTEGSRNACLTAISAGDDCQQLVLEVVWKRNTSFGEYIESSEVESCATGETVANSVAGEAVVGA